MGGSWVFFFIYVCVCVYVCMYWGGGDRPLLRLNNWLFVVGSSIMYNVHRSVMGPVFSFLFFSFFVNEAYHHSKGERTRKRKIERKKKKKIQMGFPVGLLVHKLSRFN